MNQFSLLGEIILVGELRFTPSGLPLLEFKVRHDSSQDEANLTKKVYLEINCRVAGSLAKTKLNLGDKRIFGGFMQNRSLKSQQIIFHVTSIE